jgi:hypothetical protein
MGAPAPQPSEVTRARGVAAAGAVERWFFAPIDATRLELARIGLGLLLVGSYLRLAPDLAVFYGPRGIGGHDTLARHPSFGGLAYQAFAHLRVLHHFESLAPIVALYALLVVAAAAFALGIAPRIAGAAAALLHLAFTAHNPHARAGWAWLVTPFVLYVAGTGAQARLSLPAWWRRRRGLAALSPDVPALGLRFLQLHVCAMYLVAGWERLDAPGWLHGDMVFHSLVNAGYGRFELPWAALAPVLRVATWAVFVLEPVAPVLLWIPRARRWFVPLLLAMHLGIEAFIETEGWQWLMVAGLTAFFPPQWIERIAGIPWLRSAAQKPTMPG